MKNKKIIISIILLVLLLGITSFLFIYNSEKNINDFTIKHGTLISYTGNEKVVTVPDEVKVIGSDAFSSDMGNGENLTKVIINGNVKKIDDSAFAFTFADVIVINEGTLEIGDNAFMDSYIDEIYFPASIKKVGVNIMETEEGLSNARIHVIKDSVVDKYFKENPPYGTFEIIYD